jgi:uncharacterized protein YjbI with pentapeptide repeats
VDRLALVADCGSCFGLCCVALAFERSADFPVDKDAGDPCKHLDGGFGCSIHADLRSEGYRGCTVYDCFGAGQQVSQVTFGGVSWRDAPAPSGAMFAALPVMRQLHEMLWYLLDASERVEAAIVHDEVARLHARTVELTQTHASRLPDIDLRRHRDVVAPVLQRVSALVRAPFDGPDHRGAPLLGTTLRRARLRGADFRGSLLIAADLRDADLRACDLLGADLRDARLEGADLTDCLFLTQSQVSSARGDARTRLPAAVRRPAHWGDPS